MRPDEHKSKESRKYQQRKKQAGDNSAAEIAEARKKAARARDKGAGMGAIRRRNGDFVETEEEIEERKMRQAKFSRRKIESNQSRYEEETEQDALERDAELGIDRETTDLVSMLEEKEEGSSTFFKFKEEKLFDATNSTQDMASRNILQLDFNMFENTLQLYDAESLLGLEDDMDLVQSALNNHPVVLDKPIVPSFSKNAKGYVLFKSQQPAKPNVISEADGIYLRNDGSNHRVIPKDMPQPGRQQPAAPATDDLDELLAMKQQKTVDIDTSFPSLPPAQPVKKTALPKPGSIRKPVAKKEESAVDDEAWLDDLLG
ncbi:hypothetical protein MAM1_0102d05307 [Mucor ambiguus]|uniref:Uncharacterized protein n=1 Tax=Mucor ambiguus TaxID=91626 RepID=A0A0C9M751_9FUNG|nr:hypothetical protein MAM1_0102d05307 [Mucor ambiguus]